MYLSETFDEQISHFINLDTFSYGCPIEKPTDWTEALLDGKDGGLNEEHGRNFVCRYLSFLDTAVVSPGTIMILEHTVQINEGHYQNIAEHYAN